MRITHRAKLWASPIRASAASTRKIAHQLQRSLDRWSEACAAVPIWSLPERVASEPEEHHRDKPQHQRQERIAAVATELPLAHRRVQLRVGLARGQHEPTGLHAGRKVGRRAEKLVSGRDETPSGGKRHDNGSD